MVIAQSATAIFQVGFLHVNAAAKLGVPRFLVLDARLEILSFVTRHAFGQELFAENAGQLFVPGQIARFQHGCLRQHVLVGLRDGILDRARRVAHLEAHVPKRVENFLHDLFDVGRNLPSIGAMQQHDVHVAGRIELAAAITAQGDQGQRQLRGTLPAPCRRHGCGKNMAQENVD